MRIHTLGLLALLFAAAPAARPASAPDVAAFDAVLQRYVQPDGNVRYAELHTNITPLETFVQQIGAVSPHSHPELFPTSKSALAYWINAYNSLVLWAFASEYPEDKDRLGGLIGRGLFFYRRKFPVGGKQLTLAHIENDIIREEFNEPRIHFALVCASKSCPWLANRAYTADRLEEMLEGETRRFLNQDRNIQIDREARVVRLSKLFDWYGKDFGATDADRLAFIARYRKDGNLLLSGQWKIRYFDYDWSLNDAQPSTR